MIQRLLASYLRRKWGITGKLPEPPPRPVPFAADHHPPGPSDLRSTCTQASNGLQSQDQNVSMAESTVAFGDTMCLHDLDEGAVTPPPGAASVPIPAYLAKVIDEELKASSGVLEDLETGPSGSLNRPDAGMGDLSSAVSVRSLMAYVRALDTHDQTLRATRVRKFPDIASAAVAAAAEPESMKHLSSNKTSIFKWVSQHKGAAKLLATMPVVPKGQVTWINTCALDLARLVSGLPNPIAYPASMPEETLRSFVRAINSESQPA